MEPIPGSPPYAAVRSGGSALVGIITAAWLKRPGALMVALRHGLHPFADPTTVTVVLDGEALQRILANRR
jgi:hypothetical protein